MWDGQSHKRTLLGTRGSGLGARWFGTPAQDSRGRSPFGTSESRTPSPEPPSGTALAGSPLTPSGPGSGCDTSRSPSAPFSRRRSSPPSRSFRSRSASAPTPPCSRYSTRSCFVRSRWRTPTGSSTSRPQAPNLVLSRVARRETATWCSATRCSGTSSERRRYSPESPRIWPSASVYRIATSRRRGRGCTSQGPTFRPSACARHWDASSHPPTTRVSVPTPSRCSHTAIGSRTSGAIPGSWVAPSASMDSR